MKKVVLNKEYIISIDDVTEDSIIGIEWENSIRQYLIKLEQHVYGMASFQEGLGMKMFENTKKNI